MSDMEQYIEEYGVPAPIPENYKSQEAYQAAYDAWFDGLAAFIIRKEEEKEAARLAEEEAARRQAEEEEAAQQGREEEVIRPDPLDRYPVGSYVGEGPQDAEPYDLRSVGSYVDEDGNLRTADGELLSPGTTPAMEPGVDELAGEIVAEPVTGDPAIDTGLLLLDLLDALTGEEGMTSDVDGIQEAVEGIQQALDHPLMTMMPGIWRTLPTLSLSRPGGAAAGLSGIRTTLSMIHWPVSAI